MLSYVPRTTTNETSKDADRALFVANGSGQPEALKAEGFGILTEVDVRETFKQKLGVDFRRYKILGACNPALAHEALSKAPDVGIMLPCNVVVYERDDGKAAVTAVDPMQTVAREHPELRGIAEVVRSKLERVLGSLG